MSTSNAEEVQYQIREQTADHAKFLAELEEWEKRMKEKDRQLMEQNNVTPVTPTEDNREHRNSAPSVTPIPDPAYQTRSRCKSDTNKVVQLRPSALDWKEAGNSHLKVGNYDMAIECYTSGMRKDPLNSVIPANRALSYIKQEKFDLAEKDCNTCLSIDSTYVKAYLRRGVARMGLRKFGDAEKDFKHVLRLEPKNKEARQELAKLENEKKKLMAPGDTEHRHKRKAKHGSKHGSSAAGRSDSSEPSCSKKQLLASEAPSYTGCCVIKPITKPMLLRSRKPLIPLRVRDVGIRFVAKVDSIPSPCYAVKRSAPSATITSAGGKHIPIKFAVPDGPPAVPVVPKRCYQFEVDWNMLKAYPEQQYRYLKQFPPEMFAVMFQYSMDAEIFGEILKTLSRYYIPNHADVCVTLTNLSKIGRFSSLLSMLSEEEHYHLTVLLEYLSLCSAHSSDEKAYLWTAYCSLL